MQVMPRVAQQFGVGGDLTDPANNVLLALKVLSKIEKSLDFAPEPRQPIECRLCWLVTMRGLAMCSMLVA